MTSSCGSSPSACAAPCGPATRSRASAATSSSSSSKAWLRPRKPARWPRHILEAFRDPITLRGRARGGGHISIGIALSEEGTSRDDLLQNADMAMYRAKERGRGGQFTVFDARPHGRRARSIGSTSTRRCTTSSTAARWRSHYQPLVSLADRRIVGAEALVRWNHPDHGILLPARVRQAGRGQRHHRSHRRAGARAGLPPGPDLAAGIRGHAAGRRERVGPPVPPGAPGRRGRRASCRRPGSTRARLCLEITEGLAMEDIDLTSGVLTSAARRSGSRWPSTTSGPATGPCGLTGPVPLRRREDRSELRPRHRARPGQGRPSSRRWWRCRGPSAAATIVEGVETAGPAGGARGPRVRRGPGLLLLAARLGRRVRCTPGRQRQRSASASASGAAAPPDLHIVRGERAG